MRTISALALCFIATSSVATEWPRAKAPSRAEKPRMVACPEAGPDYFRVGDSATCLKISGYVQADYVYHGGKIK